MLTGANAWDQDYEYTISGGKVTITKYIGSCAAVIIPGTIIGGRSGLQPEMGKRPNVLSLLGDMQTTLTL
jgi:hypothetical protein